MSRNKWDSFVKGAVRKHCALWRRHDLFDEFCSVAYAALWSAQEGFDSAKGNNFESYAYTCIYRALLRHFREIGFPVRIPKTQCAPLPDWCDRSRRVLLEDAEVQEQCVTVDPEPEDEAVAQLVWDAVDRLPRDLRRTVLMQYKYGRLQKQVAEIDGITREGVRSRMKRALAILRNDLRLRAHMLD